MGDVNARLQVSERGLQLLMSFEGFSATVYNDLSGNPTIGFGHKVTQAEHFRGAIDVGYAKVLLREDAAAAERTIHTSVNVMLAQTQYDALVSLVYNIGGSAFVASTLLRSLNAGNYQNAGEEFLHWNKIRQNGELVECAGLTARRAAELVMFREKNPA